MWESETSVDIQATVESVYRRLSDLTRHSDFSDGLARVEQVTPGPIEVGTRFKAFEVVPGKFTSLCEITVLEESHRIVCNAWMTGIMRTEWEYLLSRAAGGTHLVQRTRWQGASPVGSLMLHLVRRRQVPRENRATLERIKALVEAEAQSAALQQEVRR